jgi:hypothetical protein
VRDVKVEFGKRELTISMQEAKRWVEQGIAEWLPRRNRMKFTARRDPKLVARGFSAVVGGEIAKAVAESKPWAQAFVGDQGRPVYRKPCVRVRQRAPRMTPGGRCAAK